MALQLPSIKPFGNQSGVISNILNQIVFFIIFSFILILVIKMAKKYGFNVKIIYSWYNNLIQNEEEVNKALN